jgi:hypothetical protein
VTGSTPGFIFVHGGEQGGWCWERVLPLLDWPALAIDLAGRAARAGDRAETRLVDNNTELVNSVGRSGFDPYLLVCHSFGGLTVLAAEPLYETWPAHRVFVSALTPAPGEAGLDVIPILFCSFLRLRLWRPVAARRAVHLIPTWLAIRIWCRGLERADQRLIMSRLRAESPRIAFEPTPGSFAPPRPPPTSCSTRIGPCRLDYNRGWQLVSGCKMSATSMLVTRRCSTAPVNSPPRSTPSHELSSVRIDVGDQGNSDVQTVGAAGPLRLACDVTTRGVLRRHDHLTTPQDDH